MTYQLSSNVAPYVAKHNNGAKITVADKATDASGKHMFEAEIKGTDLILMKKGFAKKIFLNFEQFQGLIYFTFYAF